MTFTPTVVGSGLAGYAFLTRTRENQQALFASSPEISRRTDRFAADLAAVQTSADLMADREMLRVALGAFGLDEDLDNRAFIQRILDADLNDPEALPNRLADKRYLALARAFNFAGEDGPQSQGVGQREAIELQLAGLRSADDLLEDRALLRATLEVFGLQDDIDETFMLRGVLESDLSDPGALANTLRDPRYVELAQAFGFTQKVAADKDIYGFAAYFEDTASDFKTADDLLNDSEALGRVLDIFGIPELADRRTALRDILESDLSDPDSAANTAADTRHTALAAAFGFAARAQAEAAGETYTSRFEDFVATVSSASRAETLDDFFGNFDVLFESFDFFDLPLRGDQIDYTRNILGSDPDDPLSWVSLASDPRYQAFAGAVTFSPPQTDRVYPSGFADTIVQNYLDRQFEAAIGEQDPSLRLALSLERELNQVLSTRGSEQARWFAVLGSGPLREVFETTFQLPSGFGALDLDRQVSDLQDRSERILGTRSVADLLEPDRLDEFRRRFLSQASLGGGTFGGQSPTQNAVSLLLGTPGG